MLSEYVKTTGDSSILERALPLAERELTWWEKNRQVWVMSPYTDKEHRVYRYAVDNSAPRPESYLIGKGTHRVFNCSDINSLQLCA